MTPTTRRPAALKLSFAASRLLFSTALLSLSAVMLPSSVAQAQETSARLEGLVTDSKGFSASGIAVDITHMPSGTHASVVTNEAGRYDVSGLRLGGPYTVRFSGGGLREKVFENQFLTLGQPKILDAALDASGGTAAPVEVVEVRGVRRNFSTGAASDFRLETIAAAPTVSHDLKDIVRFDPRVEVDPTNANAISIAGTNNRFNSLTVDGIRQNDDFGLNGSGYPTQRAPIAIDWIEQVDVLTAPFDVQYSGFEGGTINAVTRSGSNEFHGAGYVYLNNAELAGNYAFGNRFSQQNSNIDVGGWVSGPILPDRVFFFFGFDQYNARASILTGPAGSGAANPVPSVTQSDFNTITSLAQSAYNYQAGGFGGPLNEYEKNMLAKVDWNISEQHRAVVEFQQSTGSIIVDQGNGATSVGATSDYYSNYQDLQQISGEIFSDWTSNFSTEFKYGHKKVRTQPTPLGNPTFANFTVFTQGGGTVVFGPDISRQANLLSNDLDQFKAKATYTLGAHAITGGWERESLSVYNLFLQRATGAYTFNSIADLANGQALQVRFAGPVNGDINSAAAVWGYDKDSYYLEDKWSLFPSLTLQAGIRYERYSSGDKPVLNPAFVAQYGFPNNASIDGKDVFLPRFGFNWRVDDDTTVRGGAGVFSGVGPNVWLSNDFSNNGITTGLVCLARVPSNQNTRVLFGCPVATPQQVSALNNVNGYAVSPIVKGMIASPTLGNATTNSLDPNLKIPSEWRYSLTVERNVDPGAFLSNYIGKDYLLGVDFVYSQIQDALFYKDLRLVAPTSGPTTTQDGRPIYVRSLPGGNDDLFLTNTNKGDGKVITAYVRKSWEDTPWGDFRFTFNYTHEDITEVTPLTSSVAFSNYTQYTVADPNANVAARSNYSINHDFKVTFDWSKEWITDFKTGFSLYGDRRSGQPYSYTFGSAAVPNTVPTNAIQLGDPSVGRQLFYVPKGPGDVLLTGGLTWQMLDTFIHQNGLDKYRGSIAPRNAFDSRWVSLIDLRVSQEVPGIFGGSHGVFTFDIHDVPNLLNKKYGQLDQIGFPYNAQVVFAAVDPATGKYIYAPISGRGNLPLNFPHDLGNAQTIQYSVWRLQVGLRYEF